MDKELKIVIGLLFFLTVLSAALVHLLAQVAIFSKSFVSGFVPFLMLLIPCILFSSKWCITLASDWIYLELNKKLLFPIHILLAYFGSVVFVHGPDWFLFLKLSLWLFIPTLIFSIGWLDKTQITFKDILVVLILWLPVEFGRFSGFDLVFTENIRLPAIPLASTAFGLYLFAVLKNLPGIGYTFLLKFKDLWTAFWGLGVLAIALVPLGISLGFIRYSALQVSPSQVIELFLGIYFLVAIPEELLFRGIIQNMACRLLKGAPLGRWIALVIASVIFGLSHWNNINPPDWRYVFLAFLAGMVYGITYMKTGKTTASALVHCGVNFIWAVIFKEATG